MVKNFNILKKLNKEIGSKGIIYMKDDLTALNSDIFIIPIWCI